MPLSPDDPDYDIYRDSLLRYAGYANEVGEAFRAQFAPYTYKGWNGPVSLTYAVAITYCAADAADKCKLVKPFNFMKIIPIRVRVVSIRP